MTGATRVVIDSNIAIAASIRIDLGHTGPVRHRIHGEALALVERLAESGAGYVVPAVRSESIGALPRAVARTMLQRLPGAAAAQMWPERYAAVMRSSTRLDEIFRSMKAARPDPGQVERNLCLVGRMSKSLMERYEALAGRGAAGGAQLPPEALQIGRFAKGHPNRGDQQILAEAAAFRGSLPAGSRVAIASSDTGFFSPYRHPGGVSDAVTAEIRRRFGIRCDHPEVILREMCGAT